MAKRARTHFKKINPHVFWLAQALLLTPPLVFLVGVFEWSSTQSTSLMRLVIGAGNDAARSFLFLILFPIAGVAYAFSYLVQKKWHKGVEGVAVRGIIVSCLMFLVALLLYFFLQNYTKRPL